ncbi:MAG: hypothetical protein K9L64_03430 [Candidatus Izimaplasma sp.]|nr:hypothetical protein [Candidatus Izimaplasma bacterium]
MSKYKKLFLYFFALNLLGLSIAFIQNTNLGMAPWDALARNFYEGVPIKYTFLSPLMSLILMLFAYLINFKRPNYKIIIPILISTYIGFAIDIALLFIPNVAELNYFYNYFYLIIAMILISIGLNVIIYCGYTLPALEHFTMAIANRLKITFGKAKLIGEIIAFSLTIFFGFIFSHQLQRFFIGETTIIVLLFIGFFVDIFKKPTYKVLERII